MSFLLSAFFFLYTSNIYSQPTQENRDGNIDLRAIDFEEIERTNLDGPWRFYWNSFIHPDSLAILPPDGYIQIPGNWFDYNVSAGQIEKAYGYGTYALTISIARDSTNYALRIPNIHTAYTLFADGEALITRGVIGKDRTTSVPSSQTAIVVLPKSSKKTIDLVFHVSNFHFSSGSGIWDSIEFGTYHNIIKSKTNNYFFTSFLVGSLFIMSLYHLVIFFMRRKDVSYLYFSIIALAFAIREMFSGEIIVFDILPDLSWDAGLRVLILCFPIALSSFTAFIWKLYPDIFHKPLLKIFIVFCGLFALCVLVFPAGIYLQIMLIFGILSNLLSFYILMKLVQAVRLKLEGAVLFFIGTGVMIFASIHDLMVQMALIEGRYYLPLAFLVFIVCQSLVLALRYANSFFRVDELSTELMQTNLSYARFVPKEFARYLNQKDISKVDLGEWVEANMTIMFADIKGFSTIAEKLSPEETFSFLNNIFSQIGPIIRKYGGFVDKYIGDELMAIFPTKPEDALLSALEIQKTLKNLNHNPGTIKIQAEVGIGIHTGNLIMGIIGEPERIESTVISDAVNISSRVQSLTRTHGVNIIVTEDVIDKIQQSSDFSFNFLDNSQIKGREGSVNIYELKIQ